MTEMQELRCVDLHRDRALLVAVAERVYGRLRTEASQEAGAGLVLPHVEAVLAELGQREVVEWGVVRRYPPGSGLPPESVESFGTRPGGDVGPFTEDHVRYIAGADTGRIRRRVRLEVPARFTEWEPVDG